MKKTHLFYLVTVLILAGCSKEKEDFSRETAKTSISDFKSLVNEQNYRVLGFNSFAETSEMTLGDPLSIYFIGLTEIKNFTENDDPENLFAKPVETIYPVNVRDEVRSSVSVKKSGEEWIVTGFGRPKWIKAVNRIIADSPGKEDSGYFIVEIPSLYLLLIGRREQGKLFLTHVHDHDDLNFKAGETGLATEVLSKIQQATKDDKGALSKL